MPPYRAQLGGIAGSGVYQHPSAAPDWGAIIGSIGSGASSLIHNAYLRKIADRNYALNVQRLNNEMELHKATLAATQAYHQAILGTQQQRIAAPDARKTKANQQAFNDLQKEFPEHHLVAPDAETGETRSFDPEQQDDYVGALRTARGAKVKADAALTAEKYKTDNMEKAAKLRQWVQSNGITQRAGAKAAAGPTPAQTEKMKQDFLKQVGVLSGGDKQKARDIIGADADLAASASRFGVKDYELDAAAGAVGAKQSAADAAQAGRIFSGGMAKTPEEAAAAVPRLKVPTSAAPAAGGAPASTATPSGGAGSAATPPALRLPVVPSEAGSAGRPGDTGVPAQPAAVPPRLRLPVGPAAPPITKSTTATYDADGIPTLDYHNGGAAAPAAPAAYPSQAAHWDAAAAALRKKGSKDEDIAKVLGARPAEAAAPAAAAPAKPEEEEEEPPVSSGII